MLIDAKHVQTLMSSIGSFFSPLSTCFHMPVTTCSQATRDQETTPMDMEGRLAKMEEKLRKAIVELEALQQENEDLKCKNAALREDTTPSHVDRTEVVSQSMSKSLVGDEEKRRMH